MFKLRKYQKEAIEKALDFFQNDGKGIPIIVAPTAAGKSLYIGYIVNALKQGVLVLQPRKELLEQNLAKYRSYGATASVYSASMGEKDIGHVTFATIGSIKTRASEFQHVKYIIIDECHLVPPNIDSMYMKFMQGMPQARTLGLTATAFRSKKYLDPFNNNKTYSKINLLPYERPRFFNNFLHITQISELYDLGYLAPIKYIELKWKNGNLVVNTTGAEYTEESMDKAMDDQQIHERLPDIVAQATRKGRKHCLVFVRTVEKAMRLACIVPDSAAVSADTNKKDREQILGDFKSGKIKTVFNVGVLTVGFDFPELDTVILARPTMSLTLYMQMVGRGIRIHPNKTDCALVDMCGNLEKFGKIEEIKYEKNFKDKWVVKSGNKILSGVKIE